MDKKQPFFLIMVMMIFGVALSSAMWVFSKNNVTSHRDLIVSEISHIAADAFQFRDQYARVRRHGDARLLRDEGGRPADERGIG